MIDFDDKIQLLLKKTALQYMIYKKNEDLERLEKTVLFANKLIKKEYTIGFAGHFSAGKSSMINALTGSQLLPSSPIPTSANVVKVHKSQENYAIAYLTSEEPIRFNADYDIKTVKELSKNGALVSQIEIGHSESVLPMGVTVMDTPGVDSTDDAHRMSTESALHLADIVFYVMDYNHVQSELNFQFTKTLMKYNPNVYLIVNQVDKHKDEELSFTDFKQSVSDSFGNWGVFPKNIFFTSLREKNLTYNDFEEVQAIVMNSIDGWQEQLVINAENTLAQMHDEHGLFLEQNKQDLIDGNEELLSANDWQRRDDILDEYGSVVRQLELYSVEKWEQTFNERRDELLENAVLMPFELRDRLATFVEGMQKDFKVGLLFAAKKTEAERQRRKDDLYDRYQSIVGAQISGHMLKLMKTSLQEVGALTDELSLEIDDFQFDIPFAVIENEMRSNALAGDALLNFANRVQQATRMWFKRATDDWKLEKKAYIKQLSLVKIEPLKKKKAAMTEKVAVIHEVQAIEEQQKYFKIQQSVDVRTLNKEADAHMKRWAAEEQSARENMRIFDPSMFMLKEAEVEADEREDDSQQAYNMQLDKAISHALATANAVEPIAGFQEVASYLKNKVARLEEKDFTIALFGAFSAGKSSFSNALMGQRVLPVSPNPTTAAINKIRPVSENHPHETADVKLKTVEAMTADIQASYNAIGIRVTSLDDAFNKAQEALDVKLTDERLHVHKSFVRAFAQGYEQFKDQLGTTIRTEKDDFELFVAQENRSCFVDSIDFFYDCELTRLGVTLVDTPGADSINARHTGVAFEYIRNADAILFITYYNHAFAKADREFLIQLGRVKDAFELDKMFFVVNAIDLATDAQEAEDVKDYVRNELLRFGIRKPRLFGVSSLLALREKVENTELASGLKPFEESFHHFLSDELMAIAVQALEEETMKTTERLSLLIKQTEDNLSRKEERLAELQQIEDFVKVTFASTAATVMKKDIANEQKELIYYVLQRVYFRYTDFFKESYNPTVFNTKSTADALQFALTELMASLSFDFEQEMRVTNFRISKFIVQKTAERYTADARKMKDVNESFSFTPFELEEPAILDYSGPFKEPMNYKEVNKLYKNQKSFFENNERFVLRDALEELSKPDAQQYLDEQSARMTEWAEKNIDDITTRLSRHIENQALEQLDTERGLLQENSKLPEWKAIFESLVKDIS
ncbi:dynamin family protein [Kurthia sibirica]|uniref:GTPase n=1 Tax=Kurthia sibirica TaxID=202750 RepID=A0A2U3APP8_9BACL|nr:dynamin family protein [Kurthia sibirica]PWI26489.1 GTPase [Kurthia sibirica]GEK33058.1 GTPase [Kurthia sibirica]